MLLTLIELGAPLDTGENEPPLLQLAVNADRRDAFDALVRAGAPTS